MDKKSLLPYQKLLLSATLTRNPEKLEQVNLFKPIYFNVAAEKLKSSPEKTKETNSVEKHKEPKSAENKIENSVLVKDQPPDQTEPVKENLKAKEENVENSNEISVPDELSELMIEVTASQKPLTAIYLIKSLGYRRMLCFVKSIDTAKRLTKLLELNNIKAMEYSSSLHVARRKRVQAKFEKDEIDVLVCSDVMARGMDLENVDYVLLYDSAAYLNSYIHKVGRTARAGRSGTAISFLEHKEIFFFKKMMAQIKKKHSEDENTPPKPHKVKEFKIQKSKFKPFLPEYSESLTKLKNALKEAATVSNSKPGVKAETAGSVDEKGKAKRKHLKERGEKFIKRQKQKDRKSVV